MKSLNSYLQNRSHRELFEEYCDLPSAEDRLSWLMERPPVHTPVPDAECAPEKKVPGCLSSLWLYSENRGGRCYYSARSESDMVQGIVSFICDLYSERSPAEILEIGDTLVSLLGIEKLLSTTRRRAVLNTVGFIQQHALASSEECLTA